MERNNFIIFNCFGESGKNAYEIKYDIFKLHMYSTFHDHQFLNYMLITFLFLFHRRSSLAKLRSVALEHLDERDV